MEENKINSSNAAGQGGKLPPRPMPPKPPKHNNEKQVESDFVKDENSVAGEKHSQAPSQNKLEKSAENEKKSQISQDSQKSPETVSAEQKSEQSAQSNKQDNTAQVGKNDSSIKKNEDTKNKARVSKRAKSRAEKRKIAIIIAASVGALLLLVGVVLLVYFLTRPVVPVSTPQNLKIYSSGSDLYAACDSVEGAQEYVFKVNDKEFRMDVPYMNLTSFGEPNLYRVKVRAVGKKDKSTSTYSQTVSFEVRLKLDAPVIMRESSASNKIIWASVEGAESYDVCYNDKKINVGNVNSFDLTNLGGGEFNVCVIAKGNSLYIIQSEQSNSIIHTYIEKLSGLGGKLLDGGIVEINRVEHASGYIVTVNSQHFKVDQFEEEKFMFDPNLVSDYTISQITYLRIEAVGEGFYESSNYEIPI